MIQQEETPIRLKLPLTHLNQEKVAHQFQALVMSTVKTNLYIAAYQVPLGCSTPHLINTIQGSIELSH